MVIKNSEFRPAGGMTRPETTVNEYDDEYRKQRLRETRTGHSWDQRGVATRIAGRIALSGMTIGAAISVVGAQYWEHDVLPERERLAQTQPEIHEIHQSEDSQNDTAFVDMVGLGNLDASETATTLVSPYSEIGDVWAVQYDNSGIDTKVISHMIEQKANERGIEKIALAGHSMGGVVALEVAQHLYEETDIDLLAVVLDCTPIDLDAVRPDERSRGQDMMRWIGRIPGARESRSVRMIVETVARKERFIGEDLWQDPSIDFEAMRNVLLQVWHEKILSKNVASNGLIESQFAAITASGARENIKAIAQVLDGKIQPVIVFMRPKFNTDDTVVDNDKTQRALLDSRRDNNFDLVVTRTNTGHANPNQDPGEYTLALQQTIVPVILEKSKDTIFSTDLLAKDN